MVEMGIIKCPQSVRKIQMKLSVFGLGYVGAVSSACLAKLGHQVIGVDINETKINLINDGRPPVIEDKIEDITSTVVTDGRLRAISDTKTAVIDSDVSLVSVGTPSSGDGAFHSKPLIQSSSRSATQFGQNPDATRL